MKETLKTIFIFWLALQVAGCLVWIFYPVMFAIIDRLF